jgi:hypothetical protein
VSGIEVEIPTFQNRPLASEQLNPRASDAQYRPTDIAVAPSCPSPGEVRTHERLSREAPRLTLNSLGQCVIRLLSAPDACELPNRHSNDENKQSHPKPGHSHSLRVGTNPKRVSPNAGCGRTIDGRALDVGELRPNGRYAIAGMGGHYRSLGAVVAIFETHDVIKLGNACLKDDRVLKGSHAVPSAGPEMHCFARE